MGIPLVALQGQGAPDPLRQANEAMQLSALRGQMALQPGQLQLQQQQIEAQKRQLSDQQARTAALQEWSEVPGSMPMSELPRLVVKHGGSADAALQMQQSILAQQTQLTTLDKDKLANAQAHTNAIGAAAQAVLGVSPENRPQAYALKMKELAAQGVISPQEAQTPYDEDSVKLHAAAAMSAKDQIDTELKKRETAAQELQAQARMTAASKPPQEVTDIADYTKTYLAAKGLQDTPSNQLIARQQYYKDKQPFGAQKIQIEQQKADIAQTKADQDKAASLEWKPKVTADEKKKAELAENIAENATAVNATLARRSDLIGAIAGRFTNVEQMIGNNDKDISAIGNRIHNIAMANSGVHGFRSQEGVKDTEATILNHFKNGPDAVKGALASNVDSVQTFIDNARPESYQTHSKQGGAGGYYQKKMGNSAPPANLLKEGIHTTFKNGQTWTLQGGKPVQVQ